MRDDEIRLLGQALEGDHQAYEALYARFELRLCGAIRWRAGHDAESAASWAHETWGKCRESILRPPAEGGYSADKGLFHRWVIEQCTGWGQVRPEDWVPAREVAWPRNDQGDLIELPDPKQLGADEIAQMRRRFGLLLEIIFLPATGYPHQQLCFVLSKYLHGRWTRRGVDGSPGVVAEEYCQCQLGGLAQVVRDQCRAIEVPDRDPSEPAPRWFAGFCERLAQKVADIMAGDGASLTQFQALRHCCARDTRLAEYLAGSERSAEAAISLWCNRGGNGVRSR